MNIELGDAVPDRCHQVSVFHDLPCDHPRPVSHQSAPLRACRPQLAIPARRSSGLLREFEKRPRMLNQPSNPEPHQIRTRNTLLGRKLDELAPALFG
jgi:hypothetical protein